jgi:hypothetical protein
VIVGDPRALSVYVTWQLKEFITVQGEPMNEPVVSEVLKETNPEDLDVAVAVQVVVDPKLNDGHDTDMEAAPAKCIRPTRRKASKPIAGTTLFFPMEPPRYLMNARIYISWLWP